MTTESAIIEANDLVIDEKQKDAINRIVEELHKVRKQARALDFDNHVLRDREAWLNKRIVRLTEEVQGLREEMARGNS